MSTDNVYQRNGYANREEYLASIADDMGLEDYDVGVLADLLGEDEDFDGLISTLEDYASSTGYRKGDEE